MGHSPRVAPLLYTLYRTFSTRKHPNLGQDLILCS